MPNSGGSKPLFWLVAVPVVLLDFLSKLAAVTYLSQIPQPFVGQLVQLQLVFNRGAAFGVYLGDHSRWIFGGLAVVALGILGTMVHRSNPAHRTRLVALGLVCGGAVGNLIDRFRGPRGVVDFIDVGINFHRWPTFNLADLSVVTGAALLVWVLGREGRTTPSQPSDASASVPGAR